MTRMARTILLVTVGIFLTVALIGQTRPQQAPREVAAIQIDARPVGAQETSPAQQSQTPAIQLEQTNPNVTDTPIKIELDTPVPLKLLLSGIAQNAGLNLQMLDALDRKVTANLKDVTLDEALHLILQPEKLDYKIEGKILSVFRPKMITETLEFIYVTAARSRSTSMSASATAGFSGGGVGGLSAAGGGVSGGSSTSISGSDTTNLLAQIETELQNYRSKDPGSSFGYNKQLGLISVTDYPDVIASMKHYLDEMRAAAGMQVTIEARLIEVQLNRTSQAGINWSLVLGNSLNFSSNFAQQSSFSGLVTFKGFSSLMTALQNYGDVNVLSSPSVSTLNGQPAVVKIGTQDVFFVTQVQTDPRTGTLLQTAETPATVNEGVVLDVTPNMGKDGTVYMSVHPTITERTGEKVSPQGNSVPLIDLRETDVVLKVRDGDTIVLAGLISSKELRTSAKTPLSGLPLIGGFFGKKTKEIKKTDLVIMLTPHIYSQSDIPKISRDREDQLELLRQEQAKEFEKPGKGKDKNKK
jgi:MSHA biogenesis protein MshL